MTRSLDNFDHDIGEIDFSPNTQDGYDSLISVSSSSSYISSGIVTYKGKKYASGLTWLSYDDNENTVSNKKKAQSIGADFICDRSFVNQTGFGYLKRGHKIGMISLAAIAADALVGEWHGVFEADNGWVYVAVHADNIAPNGDLFFYSEQEAYNHFVTQAESFKWPKTYVPESWNLKANDGEILIDKFLENSSPTALVPANLDAVFYGKANKFLFFALSIAALLIFILYYSVIPNLNTETAQGTVVRSGNLGLLQIPPQEVANILDSVSPVIQSRILNPTVFITKCMTNIESLIFSIPGWSAQSAVCLEDRVTVTWRNDLGDITLLQEYLNNLPKQFVINFDGGNEISINSFFSYRNDDLVKLELYSQAETMDYITDTFGRLGSISVTSRSSEPNSLRNTLSQVGSEQIIPLSVLPKYHFNLSTPLSFSDLKEKFNIPAIKFNNVEWNIKTGIWTYDAFIYTKETRNSQGQQ